MNGFVQRLLSILGGVTLLTLVQGCCSYRDVVDPCYPDRYMHAARQNLNDAVAPQVMNGHVLDQTVWNYHFETDSERLTAGGLEHLAYLARRRPTPDTVIYLQSAYDIPPYDPTSPKKFADRRAELNNLRVQAVQTYLTAQTVGRNLSFQVLVHDPAETGMSAVPARQSIFRLFEASPGTLPSAASGAGAANVSGGAGARQ